MFGWLKRRGYRNEAVVTLIALTGSFRKGVDKALLRDYPNLPKAIEDCRVEGLKVEQTALRLGAILVADLIEGLPPERRAQLLAELEETGPVPLGPGVGHMFWFADNQRRHGAVTDDDFAVFRSEIVGALQGLDARERSDRRIYASIGVGAAP